MNWKKYIPTATERGEWQGLLSTYSEWHSLGIGLAIGIIAAALARPELLMSIALIAVGEAEAQGEQLRDVAKEPALSLAGLAVGYAGFGGTLNPEAIQRLVELLQLAGGV